MKILLPLLLAFSFRLQAQDCANPPIVYAGPDKTTSGGWAKLEGSAVNTSRVKWTTTGTGYFNDSKVLDAAYAFSKSD